MPESNKKTRRLRKLDREHVSILAKRITENRIRLGLNQAGLASKIGVVKAAISSWETGVAIPFHENMQKLADAFGISVEELTKGWSRYKDRLGGQGRTRGDKVRVGENLARARKLAGLTQQQLASLVGLKHPMAISKWERGGLLPANRDFLEKISAAVGISVEALLDKEPILVDTYKSRTEPEMLNLLAKVREISRAIQEMETDVSRLIENKG